MRGRSIRGRLLASGLRFIFIAANKKASNNSRGALPPVGPVGTAWLDANPPGRTHQLPAPALLKRVTMRGATLYHLLPSTQ